MIFLKLLLELGFDFDKSLDYGWLDMEIIEINSSKLFREGFRKLKVI